MAWDGSFSDLHKSNMNQEFNSRTRKSHNWQHGQGQSNRASMGEARSVCNNTVAGRMSIANLSTGFNDVVVILLTK